MGKKRNGRISAAEEKELLNFERFNALSLDFQRSHRYLMTKEKFNQQDVDYVFALEKKERDDNVESDMLEKNLDYDHTMSDMNNPNASASGTYLMLIMKSVFGGMKDRFTRAFPDQKAADKEEMVNWLSADTVSCITSHKQEMETILRGIKHSAKDPDKEKIENGFSDLLTRWIHQLFRKDTKKQDYISMVNSMTNRSGAVMGKTKKIITIVMSENA